MNKGNGYNLRIQWSLMDVFLLLKPDIQIDEINILGEKEDGFYQIKLLWSRYCMNRSLYIYT